MDAFCDYDEAYGGTQYSQSELQIREDYMTLLEESSSELIYDPKDMRKTDPEIYKRFVGDDEISFEEAFIKFLVEAAKIFTVVDRYDMLSLALDFVDHYMNVHPGEKLPFDFQSGRSTTLFMNKIRRNESVKDIIAAEALSSDKQVSQFYNVVQTIVRQQTRKLRSIFQVELMEQKYREPTAEGQLPWNLSYNPDADYESICLRICANGEGIAMKPHVETDYDFNRESFLDFLRSFGSFSKCSTSKPVLLLIPPAVKSFSLEALDFGYQHGIRMLALPLEMLGEGPLSRRIVGLIGECFTKTYSDQFSSNQSLKTPKGVKSLLISCTEQVFVENRIVVEEDFSSVLQIGDCLSSSQSQKSDEKASSSEHSDNELGIHRKSQSEVEEICQKKTKRTDVENEEDETELNELMFAQVGPLRESDYY